MIRKTGVKSSLSQVNVTIAVSKGTLLIDPIRLTGRSWKVEELRNKSNSDLHKLWYVLLKERNMLLTMQEAHKRESDPLPSEERIWKVKDSMANLEQVVCERNKAYWQLEVDQNETGQRPVSFHKDVYGRYRW